MLQLYCVGLGKEEKKLIFEQKYAFCLGQINSGNGFFALEFEVLGNELVVVLQ